MRLLAALLSALLSGGAVALVLQQQNEGRNEGLYAQEAQQEPDSNNKTLAGRDVPTLQQLGSTMDVLEKKIKGLNLDLGGIQANITSLESVTARGLNEVNSVRKAIADAGRTSQQNSVMAAKLEVNAVEIEGRLGNNTRKLEALEEYLGKLGENIQVLGSTGTDTAQRVNKLEKLVNETVPTGSIAKQMKDVEDKLTTFEGELDKGVDKEIKAYMKTAVDDMRNEVRALGRATKKSVEA